MTYMWSYPGFQKGLYVGTKELDCFALYESIAKHVEGLTGRVQDPLACDAWKSLEGNDEECRKCFAPLFSRCDSPEAMEVICHFLCQRSRDGKPLIEKFGKMAVVSHPDQEPKLHPKQNVKNFGEYLPQGPQPGPAEYVLDYGDKDHRDKVAKIAAGKVEGYWAVGCHAMASNCLAKIKDCIL